MKFGFLVFVILVVLVLWVAWRDAVARDFNAFASLRHRTRWVRALPYAWLAALLFMLSVLGNAVDVYVVWHPTPTKLGQPL